MNQRTSALTTSRFLTLFGLVLALLITTSGCDTQSTFGKLKKGGEYLFEMKNENAEKYNMLPAFRGTVVRTRGKGKKEILTIRVHNSGAPQKVPRKAFVKISAL